MPSAARSPGCESQGRLPLTLPHPSHLGIPKAWGVNFLGEGAPRGPSDCPRLSLGKRRLDQWPLGPEGEDGSKKREEVVVKRIGAGRAGVPWVWDPKSSHHSRLLTRGWEGEGERWGGRALW